MNFFTNPERRTQRIRLGIGVNYLLAAAVAFLMERSGYTMSPAEALRRAINPGANKPLVEKVIPQQAEVPSMLSDKPELVRAFMTQNGCEMVNAPATASVAFKREKGFALKHFGVTQSAYEFYRANNLLALASLIGDGGISALGAGGTILTAQEQVAVLQVETRITGGTGGSKDFVERSQTASVVQPGAIAYTGLIGETEPTGLTGAHPLGDAAAYQLAALCRSGYKPTPQEVANAAQVTGYGSNLDPQGSN